MKKTLSSQYWQLGLVGVLGLSVAIGEAVLQTFASSFDSAFAQSRIVPDTTLGAENSRVVPFDAIGLPIDVINGGAK